MKRRLERPDETGSRLDRESLSPAERAEMWTQLASAELPARRGPRWALVSAAAVMGVATAALWLGTRPASPGGGPVAESGACAVEPSAPELALAAGCAPRSIAMEDSDWELQPGTRVARAQSGARMLEGTVRFRVRPRPPGREFRVAVSGGHAVRVVGTVFEVEQHADAGRVAVREGLVEFAWSSGKIEAVGAGQTLRWPRAPEPVGDDEPQDSADVARTDPEAKPAAAPKATRAESPRLDAPALMERVLQLESQDRFDELVELLRQTLRQPGIEEKQRERLSFELGRALEGAGGDACLHWRRHAARFGRGRHPQVLEQRLRACDP